MQGMVSEKKKVIWLVNKHAVPLCYYGAHARTVKLAENFVRMGYDVRVIGASTVHNSGIDLITNGAPFMEKEYDGVKFIHIKTANYRSNGVKRLWSLMQFAGRVRKYSRFFPKPDIIIHTSNLPFDRAIYGCARRYHARYIVEVLDLWPEAFVAFGIMKKGNPALIPMYYLEKKQYQKADHVVFSMEGGVRYIIDKGWDKGSGGSIDSANVKYINNGIDLDECRRNCTLYRLQDDDLSRDDIKRVIYLGSIRKVNHVDSILEAAKHFLDRKDVLFLIYGDGSERERLEVKAKEEQLHNVIFKERWIKPEYVPYVQSRAAVNLMNYLSTPIKQYGGSQNKLFLLIASGCPICCNAGMEYSLIDKHRLGIDRVFKSSKEYADAINALLEMSAEDRKALKQRADEVIDQFDYAFLASEYGELFGFE